MNTSAHFSQTAGKGFCFIRRRTFLKGILGSAAGAAILPHLGCTREAPSLETLASAAAKIPGGGTGDELFWRKVAEQFPLRDDLVMVNAANLCPSPIPVQNVLLDYIRDEDADPSGTNRIKFRELREQTRVELAEYLGADSGEIALTRNTSESNNTVLNGLELGRNDEVVIWEQNHPTNNIAWDVRAEWRGFSVKRVSLPRFPDSTDDLIKSFRAALTRRTRIVSFSHVSNISGLALPAKEICRLAHENGALAMIDGAQTFGSQVVDLHDIDCDFYTGSADKWFCGPEEVGVLYVKKEQIEKLRPSIVGVDWTSAVKSGARKFESFGQRNDATLAALGKTVEFSNLIGKRRIESRIATLAEQVKAEVKKNIPDVQFITPREQEFVSGVVVFTSSAIDLSTALDRLYREHSVGCAVFGGDHPGIRFSANIYNSPEDIERAAAAVRQLV